MNVLESKSFNAADDVRRMDKTTVEMVQVGDAKVARFTFAPGWRWSECVSPVVGTDTCQAHHVGAVVSGRMHVVLDDGSEGDVGPGDAYNIPPGHDAWNTGDEDVVVLEFASAATYGTPG
ncbi:MAG: cupin domain-containing protein [Candidatus Nanopelagicales bacterium]